MPIDQAGPIPKEGKAQRVRTFRTGAALGALSGLCLLVALGLMVIPNSVHVDTSYADEAFFDCGLAVAPRALPAEEPGISACESLTTKKRGAAALFALGGLALLLTGVTMLLRARGRQHLARTHP